MIRHIVKRASRRTFAIAALPLAMGFIGQAHAQWQVIDASSIASNEKGQTAQLLQTVTDYKQMITQYESLLSKLQSLNLNIMPVNNQLTTIDNPAAIVQQTCPSASLGGTIVGALGMNPSLVDGEIVSQQATICANIVLLQVDKYNTVAKMLNHMNDYFSAIQNMSSQLDQLGQTVGGILGSVSGSPGSSGDRQGMQNQADQMANSLATEMAQVQQHLQAVDATISTLQAQQSMLANIALKGSNATGLNALTGQIIQAGAFAAAFPQ